MALIVAAVCACDRAEPSAGPVFHEAVVPEAVSSASGALLPREPPRSLVLRGMLREVTWHYDQTPFGPSDVVVTIPADLSPGEKLPVLVAFHGRGESLKGPARGSRGWVDDYAMGTTVRRLKAPPLTSDDFLGFVTSERLTAINRELVAHPYQGLVVVCPYLPDGFRGPSGIDQARLLAGFITEKLLPRAYAETPAVGTAASTGVDGVSLGGRASLLVGFLRPEAFGAVGALQPAIDDAEAAKFADLARAAHTKNPALKIRLLTSDGDYFLEPTKLLAGTLETDRVPYHLDIVTGPHGYDFNRGPGGYEMLLFHDRALR